MNQKTTSHAGGLAKGGARNAGKKDGYWHFVALEHVISEHIVKVLVAGRVLAGNPGMEAVLSYAESQGSDPNILVLFLDMIQRPGEWPQRMTWVPAGFEQPLLHDGPYASAKITDGEIATTVPFHKR